MYIIMLSENNEDFTSFFPILLSLPYSTSSDFKLYVVLKKWERCCCCQVASVVSDSVRPHRRQPTRLPRPWDSPGKNTAVGCHFLLQCMKVKRESEVAQSCPTLSDPMDCSPPGSSVHGIFQARVLEWGAIAFSDERADVLISFLILVSKRLRAGGERSNRGWDGWIVSLIQWTWVWENSGR